MILVDLVGWGLGLEPVLFLGGNVDSVTLDPKDDTLDFVGPPILVLHNCLDWKPLTLSPPVPPLQTRSELREGIFN